MATHNVDIVPYFAEKVVVLKEGKMVFSGSPYEFFVETSNLEFLNLRAPTPTEIFIPYRASLEKLPLTREEAQVLLKIYFKKSSYGTH